MKTTYVLVDCENVQAPAISLLKDEGFKVLLFFGPKNHCLKLELVESLQNLNSRAVIVRMGTGGHNALDFRIAYQLGRLVKEDPDGKFVVISKDKGYEPLIQSLQSEQVQVGRSDSIEMFLGRPRPADQVRPSGGGPDKRNLTNRVLVNLRARKGARPAKKKTLLGTIRDVCGKDLPESTIEWIFNDLIAMRIITVSENRIHYSLKEIEAGRGQNRRGRRAWRAGEVDRFNQRISVGVDLPPRPSATPPVPGGESFFALF